MKLIAALLILVFISLPALALVPPSERMESPALEARAQALYQELRCVVCQSQNLAGSDSEMAAAMRAAVREQLEQGKSDKDIRAFMQSRYGDSILMSPPLGAATWLLWLMPLLILATGGLLTMKIIRKAA